MKKSLQHTEKKKEMFEKLTNRRTEEIQNLLKQIDFNNFAYHYKSKSIPKKDFIGFKGPLQFL